MANKTTLQCLFIFDGLLILLKEGDRELPAPSFMPLPVYVKSFKPVYTKLFKPVYGSVSAGQEKCLFYVPFFLKSRKLVWPNQAMLMTSVDLR